MEDQDLVISVELAERVYKVRIKREDEEIFRKAVNVVKERTNEYAKLYAYKDKQDLLAMVLLQYVTQYVKIEDEHILNDNDLVTKLQDIDQMLNNELTK